MEQKLRKNELYFLKIKDMFMYVMNVRTFLVAASCSSRVFTRLIAAFNIASFSGGIAAGFAVRVFTFSSSSAMRFTIDM